MRNVVIALVMLSAWSRLTFADAIIPPAPSIAASSYLLVEHYSNQVLLERDADVPREPASLTKLMTAYVVFQELRAGRIQLQDQVSISAKAWRATGSRTFLEVGKKVPLEILLLGMIIQSGNDASIALAEHIAGREEVFVGLMNQRARELNMTASNFVNATGLPEANHLTSARDLAKLAQALVRDFPEYYKWYSQKEFTYNDIVQQNRNRLLWQDATVDGLKTGHHQSAGYCLVASSERDNMRLITVILGAKSENSRIEETQKLFSYGFRFFETHRLYGANEALTKVEIFKGAMNQLPIGLGEPLYVTVPRGKYQNLAAAIKLPPVITAPAVTGQQFGNVTVTLDGAPVADRPLIALESVQEGGIVDRLYDEVRLMFK